MLIKLCDDGDDGEIFLSDAKVEGGYIAVLVNGQEAIVDRDELLRAVKAFGHRPCGD